MGARVAAGGADAVGARLRGGGGCCRRADTVGKTHAAGGRMPQDRTRIRTAALFAHRSTACHGFTPPVTERQLP